MKSIYLSKEWSTDISNSLVTGEEKVVASCFDEQNRETYFATSLKRILCLSHGDRNVTEIELPIHEDPTKNEDSIIGLEYIHEGNYMCIAFLLGDILVYSKREKTIDLIGSIESGLQCMSWSPDQDVVLFVSGKHTLLQMTRDWDMLFEVPVDASQRGTHALVSVGWGRSETQFRGTEGKLVASKSDQAATFKQLSEDDDFSAHISWRQDGQSFVLNTIDTLDDQQTSITDNSTAHRKLRVYHRNGTLSSISEPLPQLEQCIAWRPSGSLIASSQRLCGRHDIIFFEPIGLRHGEFSLRESLNTRVCDIQWSADGEWLFVFMQRDRQDVIQVWSSTNYHWYIKHERVFPKNTVISVHPSISNADCLSVTLFNAIIEYHFAGRIITIAGPDHSGRVAVIDGCQLLITALAIVNIPPPMSQTSIKSSHTIIDANMGKSQCLLLTTHTLDWYRLVDEKSSQYLLEKSFPSTQKSMRQVVLLGECHALILSYDDATHRDTLCLMNLETMSIVNEIAMESSSPSIISLVSSSTAEDKPDESSLVVSQDGTVWSLSVREFVLKPIIHLPAPTVHVGRVFFQPSQKMGIISLTARNKLYLDQELLSSGATSYFVDENFIMFTTLAHELRMISLWHENAIQVVRDAHSMGDKHSEFIRNVERGAKIVRAYNMCIVLQMPRGNLETIYPRALVLNFIRGYLNEKQYREAFLLARTHRIDLNFLVDHDPDTFIANIGTFIDQVKLADFLNFFISSLRNDDVTETLYTGLLKNATIKTSNAVPDKINRICDLLRGELELRDTSYYIHTILTTFARKQPPQVEQALHRIQSLVDRKTSQEALSYLVFLVNVEELYQVSLGMYDLPLALLVAQQSQKDPKEYLSFINDVQQCDNEFLKKFKIDDHLKKYVKAMWSLSLSNTTPFSTSLTYIQQHKLYKDALVCYKQRPDEYRQIMASYGSHLMSMNLFEDAGLAFTTSGMLKDALLAYQRAGKWRLALTLGKQLNFSSTEMTQLSRAIYQELMESRRHDAAAIVALEYLLNVEDAFSALVEGSSYDEAMRIAALHDRLDLIETILIHEVKKHADGLLEEAKDVLLRIEEQTERLRVLRKNKLQQALIMEEEANEDTMGNVDISSEATTAVHTLASSWQAKGGSTVNSFITHKTGLTGRQHGSKKKQQKQLFKGKEGGAYEEEYLVDALTRKINWVNEKRSEVKQVIATLLTLRHVESAHSLKTIFSNCFDAIHEKMTFIYTFSQPMAISITVPVMKSELWYPTLL